VLLAQTSPRGTFKIESVTKAPPPDRDDADVSEFVVSTTDSKAKEPLNNHPETTHVSYYISPDENWIFESSHYGFRLAGGSLFKRRGGLTFERLNNQDFDELTWRFFAKTENIGPSKVPFFMGDSREGMIDFAGWSSDSGRLLVALRGGNFDGQRSRGVYRWFVYFNTKNQNFELTNYLRRLNKGAWGRYANFSEDNPDVGLVEEG
jgi:hypothetical protein